MSKASLKYYIYISATKTEMLYSQIPATFLKGAEAELKVNLGIVSTSVKGRGPEEVKELPARAVAVSSYLRDQGEVGTVEDPKAWIEGVASMRWGCVRDYASDIAFFGGMIGMKTLAMIGSSQSIVGMPKTAEGNHSLNYYTLKFFNETLAQKGFTPGRIYIPQGSTAEDDFSDLNSKAVSSAFDALVGSDTRLEYFALVMPRQNSGTLRQEKLVVATPLYVALSS